MREGTFYTYQRVRGSLEAVKVHGLIDDEKKIGYYDRDDGKYTGNKEKDGWLGKWYAIDLESGLSLHHGSSATQRGAAISATKNKEQFDKFKAKEEFREIVDEFQRLVMEAKDREMENEQEVY